MEIMIPGEANMDFDFNSARSTPYPSAPSSPRRFGQFLHTSAPTSPSRISEFYGEFDSFYMMSESSGSLTAVPFDWEEKPGTPKASQDDFAFDLSAELEKNSLTADELFDGGKIRPLRPPPRLQLEELATQKRPLLSPRSPRSPRSPISQGKKIIRQVFSPRSRDKADPFATAAEKASKRAENERGRPRRSDLSSSSRRATRSLSPYRVSEYPWEEEEKQQEESTKQTSNSKLPPPSSKAPSRRWSLKDFLFRSASEGRAKDKYPFGKYGGLFKRNEDARNTSSRSIDSSSSGSGSGSRRKGTISAHELHYTKNKAASEDLRKRTYLPYKQGILGRLAVNPVLPYKHGILGRVAVNPAS